MTTPVTDETALLTTIRDRPLDLTARLVYADYLQEQGREDEAILTRVETEPDQDRHRLDYANWLEAYPVMVACANGCGEYKNMPGFDASLCGLCMGTTTMPDPARLARAELIRVQCELANGEPRCTCLTDSDGGHGGCPYLNWLRNQARADDILREHSAAFRKGPRCLCKRHNGGTSTRIGPCPICGNTGDAGGLMLREDGHRGREFWNHRVDWVRGFPVVAATLAECVVVDGRVRCKSCIDGWVLHATNVACRVCNRTGWLPAPVPTPWLAAVVKHHRGVEMRVTNREPNTETDVTRPCWYIHNGTALDYFHWLPPALLMSMRTVCPNAEWGNAWLGSNAWIVSFATAGAAHLALQRAVPEFARRHAWSAANESARTPA